MKTAISYIRASTDPHLQKNSVAIQKAIIENFASTYGYNLVDTFTEYASGGDDEREAFNAALSMAVRDGHKLICWKVDRCARSMSIFSRIQDHLHLLRFCELGDSEPNVMVLSVLLGVAYSERINTSVRVKAAYSHLKAENPDHPWGNPNILTDATPKGLAVRRRNASVHNEHVQSICADLRKAGYCTLQSLSVRLTAMRVLTRRGKPYTPANLSRVLNYRS
jgi:DNA invertase Pin-like site-specific DNA recombinase